VDGLQLGKVEPASLVLPTWLTKARSMVALHFLHVPAFLQPPAFPPPLDTDEVWVTYPRDPTPSPTYYGHVFRAKCRFRVIINEFSQLMYREKDAKITLEQANGFYLRAKAWQDELPPELSPRSIFLPSHFQIQ